MTAGFRSSNEKKTLLNRKKNIFSIEFFQIKKIKYVSLLFVESENTFFTYFSGRMNEDFLVFDDEKPSKIVIEDREI